MTTGSAFLFAGIGILGGLFLLARFAPPRRTRATPLDDSGSAAMETVLVLPMFLTTIMVVVQCTHLMFATVLLEHAAFCVSRSASVQIPLSVDGEQPNTLHSTDNSPKLKRLNAIANVLMSPMNRRYAGPGAGYLPNWNLSVNEYLAGSFVPDPKELYGAPTVISDLFLRVAAGIAAQNEYLKWGLNLGLARVEIRNENEPLNEAYREQTRNFGDSDVLVVKVIYEYPLDVPAGGNILGPLIGYVPNPLGLDFLSKWFAKATGVRHRVDIASTYYVANWGQAEAPAAP